MTLSDETIISSSDDAVGCALGDGMAILDTRRNLYFSLNPVGAFVWDQLAEPIALREVCSRVETHFSVAPDRCRSDIEGLMRQLESNALVVLS